MHRVVQGGSLRPTMTANSVITCDKELSAPLQRVSFRGWQVSMWGCSLLMQVACLLRTMQIWRPLRMESPAMRTGRLSGLFSPDCHLGTNCALLCREKLSDREVFELCCTSACRATLKYKPFCAGSLLPKTLASGKQSRLEGKGYEEWSAWGSQSVFVGAACGEQQSQPPGLSPRR